MNVKQVAIIATIIIVFSISLTYVGMYLIGSATDQPASAKNTELKLEDSHTEDVHQEDQMHEDEMEGKDMPFVDDGESTESADVPLPTAAPPVMSDASKEEVIEQARAYQPKMMCAMVMTPARHIETGATYTFPSSCLAPGWERVEGGELD